MRFETGAPRGTWEFRRNLTIRTLQFCAAVVLLCILSPFVNHEIAQTAVTSSFTLAGAVVMSYLGAAVANDHLQRPRSPKLAKDEEIG